MKKLLALLLVLMMLTGCSKKVNCNECHQLKNGKTYTVTMLGVSLEEDICDDCIKTVRALANAIGASVK